MRLRYRRAILGPLWITISNGMVFAVIGFVYSQVLNIPVKSFVPYFAVGQVCFNFFALHISESSTCLISHEPVIKNAPQPFALYIVRVLLRNMLYLAHSLVSLLIVFLVFPDAIDLAPGNVGICVLGFTLLISFGWVVGSMVALIATRWRDVLPLVQNILTVGYLVTPILWKSSLVRPEYRWIVEINPLAAIMDLIRAPLMPQIEVSIDAAAIALCVTGVLAALALWLFRRYRSKIAFWL